MRRIVTYTTLWAKDIHLEKYDGNLNDIYVDHFVLCIKGYAKLIDDYYSSHNSPYHITVKHGHIKFNISDAEDLDWMIKKTYTIMLAAISENECGAENMWLRGRLNGQRNYPNVDTYTSVNYFKAFLCAAPHFLC